MKKDKRKHETHKTREIKKAKRGVLKKHTKAGAGFIEQVKARVPGVDFPLVLVTLGLMVFGVVMVFSASYYWSMDQYGKPYSYLIRDAAWVIIGALCMFVFSYIDYKLYKKYYKIILIVSIVLLLLLFTPLGVTVKGATRWLNLKITTLMPGEIAKIAAILFTAGYLADKKEKEINSLTGTIIPMLLICGIYGVLIMMQPNMSTAATVVAIIIAMMFIAGVRISYFVILLAIGAAAGLLYIFAGGGYHLDRVTSFLDPFADPQGDSYQVVQSLLALGSGGLFGKGLGNSIQKTLYLPEPQNDFILAIIGEELGYIGILIMVAAFAYMIWRGLKVALNAPDRFGLLLGCGVMMQIGIQLIFNIAIVTSSMPPTGVALPFVSYGGNAMVLYCIGMGIVLNISRQARKSEEQAATRKNLEERIYIN